ncbi:hypothetical protein G7081_01465 [Vagococcus coleopterorum]|uniref:DUF3784 domain-containing protein n=1 Tax=Vagococcus coleopterorum TaxID=2714946 RepID=A0A6G8ALJ7_9ENTE|nr:hypothetical protein [Vagococcus coleopterorum]QIL45850.1 hypothetical protein G7081_01465 [Vagococcus coleopterorum]
MFKYILLGIMIGFCILFLIWGRKLRQGKWLRTMAGNNDNELAKDEAVRQGKSVGILLYVMALYILCVGLAPLLGSK